LSGRPDSNRRPSPWQGDVLPTELLPQFNQYSICSTRLCKGENSVSIQLEMSKKSKKNLQKILAKRQQLQQLKPSSPTEPLLPVPEKHAALPAEPKPATQLAAYSHGRELIRTSVSIGIITLLLVAIIIFDQQRNDLETFGNWLYQALRLDQ
jgi:hypothetical protein